MIGVEFAKQLRRWRTYIGLGVVAVVPALITIAFAVRGPHHGQDADLFAVATRSGLNMPLAALSVMQGFLLVIVVAMFTGESVAGEANWGTLRYLLIRPVSRGRLLTAKLTVGATLVVLATLLIAVVGLVAGTAAFGWHDVYTTSTSCLASLGLGSGCTITPGTALLRLAASTGYVAWSMAGVACFAFMLSTMTDATFAAVAGGVGLAVLSEIMDAIPAVGSLRYALPTHYWQAWNGLFAQPTVTADMVRGTLLQLAYAAVFAAIAWWWFRRKDVLS